ncbi:hypothetical protein BD770DRAFT_386036 [Pilaira anomala]|nr:hypothetical protein BD770DRAFT_386036 [Pilaira anomala]
MSLIESNNTTIVPVNNCSNVIALETPVDSNIKPVDLSYGQCTWCGKYGHKRIGCPLLK